MIKTIRAADFDPRRNKDDSGAILRMTLPCAVKAEEGERKLIFTISTASVDRDGDTIAVGGWKLDNYLMNPVVLWSHDRWGLPIAKATRVWVEGGTALMAEAEFTPQGLVPLNDQIFEMYKAGFLRATSVGFRAIKWTYVDDKDRGFGIDFVEQELFEFSAVTVPANPDALVEARGLGAIPAVLPSPEPSSLPREAEARQRMAFAARARAGV
jgi:HK97 family phage prohead protease